MIRPQQKYWEETVLLEESQRMKNNLIFFFSSSFLLFLSAALYIIPTVSFQISIFCQDYDVDSDKIYGNLNISSFNLLVILSLWKYLSRSLCFSCKYYCFGFLCRDSTVTVVKRFLLEYVCRAEIRLWTQCNTHTHLLLLLYLQWYIK